MASKERCPICKKRGFEDDYEGCYENEIPCEIAGRRTCEECHRDVCDHCYRWNSVCADCAAKYEASEAEAERKVALWDRLVAFAADHPGVAVSMALRHLDREDARAEAARTEETRP